MKQVYFSTLKKDKSNDHDMIYEIFSLACSIYTAIQRDKKVVIVDSILFDLEYLTQYLKKYKVRVLEKEKLDYTLVAVFYGKGNKVIDLTDKVPSVFTGSFNLIHVDPCPNELKELFLCYRLNGTEYTDTYNETNQEEVVFNAYQAEYTHDYFWLDKVNLIVFQDILKHIRVKDVSPSEVCHVIHVLSQDDIVPYANQLGKSIDDYYDTLVYKYIEIMRLFIQSSTEPIVLIQNKFHPALEKYMKERSNLFLSLGLQDVSTFTEISQAKGIFVGNFNIDTLTGSACSYYLHTMIPSSQSILIDLSMIYDE